MKREAKELNNLIEQVSQKVVNKVVNEKYLVSRMAVIVNEFDPNTNSASIIIPTDLSNHTDYKYPNRTGINSLRSTVWENGQIKTYGDKVYLVYQSNNISQGWLESNKPLNIGMGDIYVKKIGDTMTGSLMLSASGANSRITLEDIANNGELRIGWTGDNTDHGLLSTGYSTNGSSLTTENKWLIRRASNGNIYVSNNSLTIDGSGNTVISGNITAQGGDITSGNLTKTSNSYNGAHSIAGKIYFISGNSATATKAIQVMNNAGTYGTIVNVNQNNVADFLGKITKQTTRETDINFTADGVRGLTHVLGTSSTTTGIPTISGSGRDGHCIHMGWDNTGGWDSQLYQTNGNAPHLFMRGQSSGTWGDWIKVYSENDSPVPFYGECSTAAATAAKTVTISNFTSNDLVAGARVYVKFTNANGVANPTLNVNGTGAKDIKRYGTTAPSTSAATSWNAGSVVCLIYDGTYWQQVGFLNNTYSEISAANISNISGSSAGLITGRRFARAVLAMVYPVGSIYMSVNNVSPATFLGGTWEQIKDTFLLSAGDTYNAGDTGGEAEHTLTTNELPKIEGQINTYASTAYTGAVISGGTGVFSGTGTSYTSAGRPQTSGSGSSYTAVKLSVGGGQAHNNMPPYLVVYMWKRTA